MKEVLGKTTRIVAESKTTVKIRDNFYSITCTEERSIPDLPEVDIDFEWKALFDSVNVQVDNQISDIIKTFQK